MSKISVCSVVLLAACAPAHAAQTAYVNSPDSFYAPGASGSYASGSNALPSLTYAPMASPSGPRWTGFTFGVQWGVGSNAAKWSDATGLYTLNGPRLPATGVGAGLIGGGNIGYSWQTRNFVIGGEAELSAAGLTNAAPCGGVLAVGGFGWACQSHTDLLSSVSLRAGFVEGDALFYGKVGLAYEQDGGSIGTWVGQAPSTQVSALQKRLGLALGGGLEIALNDHWSVRFEYDRYAFAGRSFSAQDSYYQSPYGATYSLADNLIKFGVNYRLGDPSVETAPLRLAVLDDLTADIGARTGFTTGSFAKNLYDPSVAGQQNSRLNWTAQNGAPVESFARVDHTSGVYAKIMAGGANLGGGHMTDEDFPPGITPYSKTISTTGGGRTLYATADLGYAVLHTDQYRVGGFVGYAYDQEDMSGYGCSQTQATSGVCQPSGLVPANQLTLSENQRWNAVRVGAAGDVNIGDRLTLAAEAAWLPYAHLSATDNHWLRPDIDPLKEQGVSHSSFQLEGVASYRFTDRMSIGLGARYWAFNAPVGSTQFPGVTSRSPESFNSDRTTVFVQLATKLGGLDASKAPLVSKY